MKKILFITLSALSACTDPTPIIQRQATNNPARPVELLFEHNGCKVYRFEDGGRNIYYSDCRGQVGYTYTTRQGKTTVAHHVDTLNN